MASIGILGGMGPQASSKLYELIIRKTANYTNAAIDEDYPDIVLLNVPVPNFISDKNQLAKARAMLLKKTKLLEQAGCTINGIACNTVHLLLPELQASTCVPFLSVPNLVASRIRSAGFRRVGLLATPTTLGSTLYDDAVKTAVIVRPDEAFADFIEECIYSKLSGTLTREMEDSFKKRVNQFRTVEELDAVILGCTELPLVYGDSLDKTILDSLDTLADELLVNYFQK